MPSADDFYKDELARLKAKDNQISQLSSSQQRLTLLNDSYRKRYAKYAQMLMMLVFAYIAYLGIIFGQKALPAIPSVIFDLLLILLIIAVGLYLGVSVITLYTRNVTNYDELDVPAMSDGSGVDTRDVVNSGQLTPSTTGVGDICIGQSCCPDNYHWDQATNKCIAGNPFTTLEYSMLERQPDTRFDDPLLKRSPDSGNIETTYSDTGLKYSKV